MERKEYPATIKKMSAKRATIEYDDGAVFVEELGKLNNINNFHEGDRITLIVTKRGKEINYFIE